MFCIKFKINSDSQSHNLDAPSRHILLYQLLLAFFFYGNIIKYTENHLLLQIELAI